MDTDFYVIAGDPIPNIDIATWAKAKELAKALSNDESLGAILASPYGSKIGYWYVGGRMSRYLTMFWAAQHKGLVSTRDLKPAAY
jgi:hypothetical protein